jgi:subtilisin
MKFLIAALLIPLNALATTFSEQEYVVWSDTNTTQVQVEMSVHNMRRLKHINGFVANMSSEQAKRLRATGLHVDVNGTRHILGHRVASAVGNALPWGIVAVQAPEAQKLPQGSGDGIVVCVVDTGIDASHPALIGRVIGGKAIVKSTAVGKDEWFDDMGHGTHVSGTIAGNADGLLGVAPKASLYAIKVLDDQGSGTDADVADGIEACIGHGQVINMSLGGDGPSDVIEKAGKDAAAAGIKIACAAGNNGGAIGYPAKYKECVAVSAVDVKGKLATFSSRGKEIAFAGPGVGVKSSVPGGGYDVWDGTSMATPHVAGVMAVMLARKKAKLQAKNLHLPKPYQGAGEINSLMTAK